MVQNELYPIISDDEFCGSNYFEAEVRWFSCHARREMSLGSQSVGYLYAFRRVIIQKVNRWWGVLIGVDDAGGIFRHAKASYADQSIPDYIFLPFLTRFRPRVCRGIASFEGLGKWINPLRK